MEPEKPIRNLKFHLIYKCGTIFTLTTLIIISSSSFCDAVILGNETDQLALLQIKSQIIDDPYKILSSWNESQPHCQWTGVTCGRKHERVIALDLSGKSLLGPISPHIGNLSFIRHINFINNSINGEIPQEIGRLSQLRQLILTNNTMVGEIPVSINYCTELNILRLTRNKLTGKLPSELGSLNKLASLQLGANNFYGEIPRSFGNLSSLQSISLAQNNLQGIIPNELSKLTSLTGFAIALNNFSGNFPNYLYNISSLAFISTADNPLIGTLPDNIGSTLPNLEYLAIGSNKFTGKIPYSLANASRIYLIDIGGNNFIGQIPTNLGALSELESLNIGWNQLGRDPIRDLNFLESLSNCTYLNIFYFQKNNLSGQLPDSIANLSIQLNELGMGENQISGYIPEVLGSFTNLYILKMDNNLLSGIIPSSFGNLQQIQELYLHNNQLFGEIPSSFGNISGLSTLVLSSNKLKGKIPESLGNCQRLQFLELYQNNLVGAIPPQIMKIPSLSGDLDLSQNSLNGSLPAEIGKLISLNSLDLSGNKFSGEIPISIGDCSSLEFLNLQGNNFDGNIPSTLSLLKGIQYIDLSQNNLTGNIPDVLESLVYLQYFNLSFNDLDGEIPEKGVFANSSAISILGNNKLCGGIADLELPKCPTSKANKNHKHLTFKLIIPLICVVFFLLVVTSLGVFYWRKKENKVSIDYLGEEKLMRISYWELHKATNGFCSENAIGSGGFGSVYKGKLDKQIDKLIAVKVLNLQNSKASKSFLAECKILSNVRHRNLLKILTYCSSIDSRRNEFKALVYEYMPNGNLDKWLHPDEENSSRKLNFLQRLNIAIDVALAIQYLHSECEVPIIHCDLKPSNILLDDDMCAHVGDFGLARFCPKITGEVSEVNSIGVKGTVGYAAPEYGTGNEASWYGDLYSYGIILLEMMTGKRPTDEIFINGLNIHNYVKNALPRQIRLVIDPALDIQQMEAYEDEEGDNNDEMEETEEQSEDIATSSQEEIKLIKYIFSILKIALVCSEESPIQRIGMDDVVRKLHRVKGAMLGRGRNRN